MCTTPLDKTDRLILSLLQHQGDLNNKDLSQHIGLSPSSTLERVRRLMKDGWIKQFTVKLDPDLLELDILSFVLIDVDYTSAKHTLVAQLQALPEILEIHTITGDAFFLVKIRAYDRGHLNSLISQIAEMAGVRSTKTMIAMATFKETMELPLAPNHHNDDSTIG